MYQLASLYIMLPLARDLSFFDRAEKELKVSLFSAGLEGIREDGGACCLWRGSRMVVRRR